MSLSVKIKHNIESFDLDISFESSKHGLTALFGPSGSGKSLTINIIAGLITPKTGTIILNGQILFSSEKSINIATHKRRIGYVFQDFRLFPHLSVKKNLLFGAKRARISPTDDETNSLIKLLDIEHLLDRYPKHLSGGEKQRIAIGRALLSEPQLLLLDEPFAALDHHRKEDILKLIETIRVKFQIPILLISHSISDVLRLSNQVHLLSSGRIVPADIQTNLVSLQDSANGTLKTLSRINGVIEEIDVKNQLIRIGFNEGRLWKNLITRYSVGENVVVKIDPDDVILSLHQLSHLTTLNQLKAKITKVSFVPINHVYISLLVGCTTIHCRVGSDLYMSLGLCVGDEVYTIVTRFSIDRVVI